MPPRIHVLCSTYCCGTGRVNNDVSYIQKCIAQGIRTGAWSERDSYSWPEVFRP